MTIKHFFQRIYTFIFYPFTLFRYKHFKGTVIYPHCYFKNPKYMKITNSTICRYSCLKAFKVDSSKSDKYLLTIEKGYFCDRAFISTEGGLTISHARIGPNVFIGTFKHNIERSKRDDHYNISINYPFFIGQNVSIFGNVEIKKALLLVHAR